MMYNNKLKIYQCMTINTVIEVVIIGNKLILKLDIIGTEYYWMRILFRGNIIRVNIIGREYYCE